MPKFAPLEPDVEIAQKTSLRHITEVAKKIDLSEDDLSLFGKTKAKVTLDAVKRAATREEGKYLLVTAMTATRAGDGKTVTSIGLSLALAQLGKKQCLCLRQPSLGPTFGIKGGAAGGGYSQVLPMEDINMHLTGDFHAITSANNLLSAVIDNQVFFDNELEVNPEGFANARVHIENLGKFGVPVVVAINRFMHLDTDAELAKIQHLCDEMGVPHALSEVANYGGEGGLHLARRVMEAAEGGNRPLKPLYPDSMRLKDKIETVAREIYRADGVDFDPEALEQLSNLEEWGHGHLPICMAKTQLSISDDPKKLGAPTGWRLRVRQAKVSAGAGFVVVMTGKMLLMPGMPREGAAQKIRMDPNGRVFGLS